jgi:cytochrome c biogenesis protein CcdA
MELTCTGQVYFPIVTMISEPRYRIAAIMYLFSYNVAFIVPLVIVFLLATFGVTSERMGAFFRRRIALVKFGLAVLFIAMAIMIIVNLGWL